MMYLLISIFLFIIWRYSKPDEEKKQEPLNFKQDNNLYTKYPLWDSKQSPYYE